MATISSEKVIAGFKKATTFGTEVAITSGKYLYCSQISISGGDEDFFPRDTGLDSFRTNIARLARNVNVTITCDLTYSQAWLGLVSGCLGTESTPSETTGSQGDYSETIDPATSTAGIFYTFCYNIETDRVIAIPSLKITGFTIEQAINGAGTVTIQGIADTVLESSTNAYATISGLTQYFYETSTLGGTNHYARFAAASSGSMSGSDDKTILSYSWSFNRPHQTRFGLRGANTRYTMEPLQVGPVESTLTIRMSELDNASFDLWGTWVAGTVLKGEIFVDGTAIGSGVNRSYKFQFPRLIPRGQIPSGHDVANNASLFQPEITFECAKATSAPTGMSGVTTVGRITAVHLSSSKWGT